MTQKAARGSALSVTALARSRKLGSEEDLPFLRTHPGSCVAGHRLAMLSDASRNGTGYQSSTVSP